MFVVYLLGAFMTAILVHELGHFIVALVLRRPISAFETGSGPLITEFYWKGIRFLFRLYPTSGEVRLTYLSPRTWVNVAVFLGGPVANLVTTLLLLLTGAKHPYLLWVSLYLGIWNLRPFTQGKFKSDGYRILRELKTKRVAW